MNRQDGRRPQRLTGRAPIGESGRAGRAAGGGSGERVAEPRTPGLGGKLPSGYGRTRIVLLPIDPYFVHLYWEISEQGVGFVKALVEAGALRPQAVLRFHDVTAMPVGGVRAAGSFDVEIDIEARNWYVRLLSPEKAYVVDLGFRGADGRFHRIARSNRGETPRAWPCGEGAEQLMRVVEVDGVVHVDPVEEKADVRQDTGEGTETPRVSAVSGHRPRVEVPQEARRAVAGTARTCVVSAETERFPEGGSVRRAAESPVKKNRPRPRNPRPVDGPEALRSKMVAVYGRRQISAAAEKRAGGREPPERAARRPAGIDLSLFCDLLFVSGSSSSRISENGGKDDPNEG